jgi:hypothetical protein
MAHAAIERALMVPVRGDWARRSAADLSKGPYSVDVLGRLEYGNKHLSVYIINGCLAGR